MKWFLEKVKSATKAIGKAPYDDKKLLKLPWRRLEGLWSIVKK